LTGIETGPVVPIDGVVGTHVGAWAKTIPEQKTKMIAETVSFRNLPQRFLDTAET
jgi:hypothetical protein